MSYKRGDEFVLEIETGIPGSYTVVGKATSLSNSDELSLIEANNMDSPDTSEFVADKVSLTFEAEVMMYVGEAGQTLLTEAARPTNRRSPVNLRMKDGISTIEGSFFITSRGRAASTGSIATQTFTFQNNGLWTETDAA